MCGLCGCSDHTETMHHDHDHDHHIIQVEQDLLAKNNQFASLNRSYFIKKEITAINLMSSPGSGKTTLLARTISELKHQRPMSVIVGDQHTDLDAQKLIDSGATALQVNTGKVCHLDAHMIGHSLDHASPKAHSLLFIENVGNLVCPAIFDLGEAYRVVLLSVTEGENKPLKYPDMFRTADLILLTKIDLLPYVAFDSDTCIEYARRINPSVQVLPLSTTTGVGLSSWYNWLNNPSKPISHEQ